MKNLHTEYVDSQLKTKYLRLLLFRVLIRMNEMICQYLLIGYRNVLTKNMQHEMPNFIL
jgi:hypothetical protein